MSWSLTITGHKEHGVEEGEQRALRKAAKAAGKIMRDADLGLTSVSLSAPAPANGSGILYSAATGVDKLDDPNGNGHATEEADAEPSS